MLLKILLWVLIALFFGTVMAGRKKRSKPVMVAGGLLCGGILLVSIGILLQTSENVAPPIDRTFETAAGYRIGQALAQQLPDAARVLVLNVPEKPAHTGRLRQAYFAGLERGLQGRDVALEAAPAPIEVEVHRALLGEGGRSALDAMQAMLASSPGADAVVSFLDLPGRPSGDILQSLPPVYVVQSSVSRGLLNLVRTGAIAGMVVFKTDTDWLAEPDPNASLDDVFDSRYQFLPSAD
jgi:hypothetical protein